MGMARSALDGPVSTSVLVVEPHSICRMAIVRVVLAADARLRVVAEAPDGASGIHLAERLRPDVVLLGVPDPNVLSLLGVWMERLPGSRVVVISQEGGGRMSVLALRAGAMGFVPKWAEPEEVVDAVLAARGGGTYVHPDVATEALLFAARLAGRSGQVRDQLSVFSARERQVLDLLVEGSAPPAIAARLFLSRRTVESHLSSAYRKLGVRGRIEAVHAYRRLREAADETA